MVDDNTTMGEVKDMTSAIRELSEAVMLTSVWWIAHAGHEHEGGPALDPDSYQPDKEELEIWVRDWSPAHVQGFVYWEQEALRAISLTRRGLEQAGVLEAPTDVVDKA